MEAVAPVMSTAYHAKYFAYELTKRCASDSMEKLAASLADAQVDLNPHQVEAALFAFRSPLSKGAILADEVGLGKTIEAGILLSQRWAERKRKILIIVPASLRKQWHQELSDKFFLPSVILETKTFNQQIRNGNLNPFDRSEIVICSYQFARAKEPYIRQVAWNLAVIDEAHRLRNVYKASNKIGNALKSALMPFDKLLLTATPLQNSLLELFGLVSIIDEHIFGDIKSFRSQFSRLDTETDFRSLRERLKPICQRTLRRQVLEYIPFTNRIALVEEFVPSDAEQKLYNLVSDYLQRQHLYALPASQRQLMTLILRRLLASSTFAIAGTLEGLAKKLEKAKAAHEPVVETPEEVAQTFETFEELEDEWEEQEADEKQPSAEAQERRFTPEEIEQMSAEIQSLRFFTELANSIAKNSKGERLQTALKRGLAEAKKKGGAEKAIIFTESTRTQEYVRSILESIPHYKGKIVLFNGSNNDAKSKEIYQSWLRKHEGTDRITGSKTSDMRAALVDYFRDEAIIMIATEAAAEGINLQFCSLVINYDLPWNPQRIEQRIGRCHRYGQKHDVVVVNFLNKKNAADQRVYQLLDEKFKLFSGVFGASDEVLGSIGSGIDFEKRIADIYQTCRTGEQIQFNFDQLQKELEQQIDDRIKQTRQKLLENFDEEVHEKLRVNLHESSEVLGKYDNWLWQLTRFYLQPYANFEDGQNGFTLVKNPFPEEPIHPGPYRSGKNVEDANLYRMGHPLAQKIIEQCKAFTSDSESLVFDYSNSGKKISILEPLVGKSGFMRVICETVTALETEDFVLLSGVCDDGTPIDAEQCCRFFSLGALEQGSEGLAPPEHIRARLDEELQHQQSDISEKLSRRNGAFFESEMDKLDLWAEDHRRSLKSRLEDLDAKIKEIRKEARSAPNLPTKLDLQREVREMEEKRNAAWREYDDAAKTIEVNKDALLDEISQRLNQQTECRELFLLRWHLN
jgi:superfamily II DNA/RNA helicase